MRFQKVAVRVACWRNTFVRTRALAPRWTAWIGVPGDTSFCNEYHAGLPSFWSRVYYWQTPTSGCGDSRGNTCKNYNDWVNAWNEIKG